MRSFYKELFFCYRFKNLVAFRRGGSLPCTTDFSWRLLFVNRETSNVNVTVRFFATFKILYT